MAINGKSPSLTGIWHGLYLYPDDPHPVYFVATLISHGSDFSGLSHEAVGGKAGSPLTVYAKLDGHANGEGVHFTKRYDGTGGWKHALDYEGMMSPDHAEISGSWKFPNGWNGLFLMIRGMNMSEAAIRRAFAQA